jgi:hypothetical protein
MSAKEGPVAGGITFFAALTTAASLDAKEFPKSLGVNFLSAISFTCASYASFCLRRVIASTTFLSALAS